MKKKGDKNQHAWLVKAIETQVIPRLMLAHKSDREKAESQVHLNRNKHIFSKEAIHDFTQVLLNNDADISKTSVEALIDEGVNLEDVYLELFQPSARLLGTIWEEDTEDFSAVTLALWKMQQTMYYFSDSFLNESQLIQRKGTVFLCPYPGSQHSMGLFMVSEFFRKDNWNVLGDPAITSNDLKTKISKNFFDILNLKDLPIWLFHGDKDEVIPLENSQSIYKVLKPVNKNIKLTVYKGVDHNSWDRAYDDNELYKWMLSHKETSI